MFSWVQSILVGLSGNVADVDSSNQLKVVTPPPVPPSGTTPVTILGDTPLDVGGEDNEYSYFTIPNGETLILQSIFISFEGNNAQSKVEIYDDPTATDPTGPNGGDTIPGTWNLILINHIEFNSVSIPLNENETYLGDGTRRIALRRKRLDAGARELYAKLSGYY
jgi:hypothetical protein